MFANNNQNSRRYLKTPLDLLEIPTKRKVCVTHEWRNSADVMTSRGLSGKAEEEITTTTAASASQLGDGGWRESREEQFNDYLGGITKCRWFVYG